MPHAFPHPQIRAACISSSRSPPGYLGADGDGMGESGQRMCILALLVWIITMLQEIFACYRACLAVVHVPRGRSSVLSLDADNALTISKLSLPHAALSLTVQLARLAIGIPLLWYGIQFLAYTPNIGDLLLNAVALEFVISVDELVFAALAPYKVRALVGGAASLAAPAPSRWAQCWGLRLDLRAVFRVVATAALLAVAILHVLNPQIREMVSARDALCAGDVDFVYTRDGMGAIAWAYPDRASFDGSSVNPRNFPDGTPPEIGYTADVPQLKFADSVIDALLRQQGRDAAGLRQMVDPHNNFTECSMAVCYEWKDGFQQERAGRPDCCLAKQVRVPQTKAGRFSIAVKTKESIVDAVSLWNPSCFDVLGVGAGYDGLLQGAMGDAIDADCEGGCPAATPVCLDGKCMKAKCQDVQRYCHDNSVAGVRARQLCPITCGCNSPRYPLALSLPASGCGPRCVHSGRYLAARAQLPCTDVNASDPDLVALLDDWYNVAKSFPYDWQHGSHNMLTGPRKYGCAYLASEAAMTEAVTGGIYPPYIFGVNLCTEGGVFFPVKPISYLCPVACGCRSGDAHCPDACPARTPETPICPEAQRAAMADPFSQGSCPITDHRNWGAKNTPQSADGEASSGSGEVS